MFDPRSAVAPVRAVNPVQSTITACTLPEAGESVQAGFPSPAQDFWSGDLDLSEHLIRDRTSTFIVRAVGSSMGRPGIFDGDRLIVYRAITPRHGHIIIAILDGELSVKRLHLDRGRIVLRAENSAYPDIEIPELSELSCWGVMTWGVHKT